MSHIQIIRHHNMDEEHLRSMTEELGQKLKSKFGGEYHLEGNIVHYTYHSADAKVSFDETRVKVDVKLGLLMMAFKGMIESEVNNYLDEHIS
ncbi:MAG: polyhydroxyalkanoic acid system family protein [Porticoccus sp.]|nr:polyhydroxyalkanoic acid system family protein [Porticoccus sp.]